MIVKEGNRRVAALKLIQKIVPLSGLDLPEAVATRISAVTKTWRRENKALPCTVYDSGEAATVDRIVTLAHGKGEKAGRDQWNAVARARHNRDRNGANESALDLLERYLQNGSKITAAQKARWSGSFPLSVLAEAIKRLAPRLGLTSATTLAARYPNVKHRNAVESIVHDIGLEQLGFDRIRSRDTDFAQTYGLPPTELMSDPVAGQPAAEPEGPAGSSHSGVPEGAPPKRIAAQKALATGDPRAVRRLFRAFVPRGNHRDKLVSLRDEIVALDLSRTPLALCFVIRSMFELSAKAYCRDHATSGGPSAAKSNGEDRKLADVLHDITKHLTGNKTDRARTKELHGAMMELTKASGVLSVTSMNQLIHNPQFSVSPADLSVVTANIFPLLKAMNS